MKFEDLEGATNNFSKENIVGRGGFGNVYKVNYFYMFRNSNLFSMQTISHDLKDKIEVLI